MRSQSRAKNLPAGVKLEELFAGHEDVVLRSAWSPDGSRLASPSVDKTIRIWDLQTGNFTLLRGHYHGVNQVAWSPDGTQLASSSFDRTIRIWDSTTGQEQQKLEGQHLDDIPTVAWSCNGQMLASGSVDKTIRLWEMPDGRELCTLSGHSRAVTWVKWAPDGRKFASCAHDRTIHVWDETGADPGVWTRRPFRLLKARSRDLLCIDWSPDGRFLASASWDGTIRIWDPDVGTPLMILEGHTDAVRSVSFSADGRLLASNSMDSTVRLWSCDKWQSVATLREPISEYWPPSICFHPKDPSILATLSEKDKAVQILRLDIDSLLGVSSAATSHYYSNAKVVLVGDTGVGKSGLARVLTGQQWENTESTHGRKVWTFGNEVASLSEGSEETRETLLWDLAGQPNYRLVHQLQLDEATLALVVFDSRSETTPLSGVRYWIRALRQADSVRGDMVPALKKLLVAARIDVGKATVSQARIQSVIEEGNFDGYLETSAKEGLGIAELAARIRQLIDWRKLPSIASTALFQTIKDFLLQEKEHERLLSTVQDLHRAFLLTAPELKSPTDTKDQFDICVRLVEARGLIRRLSFGNFVLLQPELLDSYASYLIEAAQNEPGEMGCIFEEDAREGRFPMAEEERLKDRQLEKLLLIATIEDILRHEVAFREQTDDGAQLVFPSQFKRERSDLPDPAGKAVIFAFQGPLLNIYATLAVRLAHSGVFIKQEMWRNAATYTARVGGLCGIYLREIEEGRGELGLFFDSLASEETRFQFEEYVHLHLQRQALPGSVRRSRIFVCGGCGFVVSPQLVEMLAAQNLADVVCPNPMCRAPISLRDREDRLKAPSKAVSGMDRLADSWREEGTAETIINGKRVTNDFDVFLCHNSVDKPQVKEIGEQLLKRGILPWLDVEQIRPGTTWQKALGEQINSIKSAAVFVGNSGIGPWQDEEIQGLLSQFVERRCPVIPTVLASATKTPELLWTLKNRHWVDFRKQDPDPLVQLVWGITGKRPSGA